MQRNFCLGSEWLYYKIYTGAKTTDLILLEKLYPAILQLKKEKKSFKNGSSFDTKIMTHILESDFYWKTKKIYQN
ncbi:lantibiotic dehydratase C-terminal domain-containing protein [Flavobacterium sp. CGRL2]